MADEIVGGLKGIKGELKGIEDQLAGLDRGSKEFIKLSQRAGELRDKMKEVKEAVGANAGPAIESLGNNARIAGEQLLSLDFEGFGQSLKSVAGNIKGVDFKSVKDGVSSMASGFGALGKALLTNPFFLIAGAVALIAMNFEKLIALFPALEKGLTGISDAERSAAAAAQARADASAKAYETIDKQSNILKLQGKSEREILEMKVKALGVAIKDRKAQLTIQQEQAKIQIDTAKRNRKILEGIIMFLTQPLQVLVGTIDLIGKAFGQEWDLRGKMNNAMAGLIIDPAEQEKELNEAIAKNQEAIATMENDYAGLQLSIKDIDKKAADDAAKANQDKLDKIAKQNADAAETEKKRLEKEAEDKLKADEAARQAAYQANLDRIAKEDAQDVLARELMAEGRDKEIAELIAHNEAKLAVAEGNAELEQQVLDKFEADKDAIINKWRQKDIDDTKAAEEKKLQVKIDNIQGWLKMAGQAVDILTSLNEATAKGDKASAKRAFDRNKKLQKAQAVINMASGIVSAFGAPDNVTMVQKIASAAVVAASGVANLVKINKATFDGGGDTNPASPGGGSTPSTALSGSNATPSTPNALNLGFLNNATTGAQPIQTYVLAGNVASSLHARQQIENQARLDK